MILVVVIGKVVAGVVRRVYVDYVDFFFELGLQLLQGRIVVGRDKVVGRRGKSKWRCKGQLVY